MLYYTGIWIGVHFEAKKYGLKGTPREELPKFGELLREKGHLAIPLIIIVYLLVTGYTPMMGLDIMFSYRASALGHRPFLYPSFS